MHVLQRPECSAPVHRIAVIRPNHRLGNTLLLTPLVGELEARFPNAQIELITAGAAAHAVFQRFTHVRAMYSFPARSYWRPDRVARVLLSLARRSYDLAIDPIPRSRAGRFLLSYVRARDRLGFRWGVPIRDRVLTHSADPALAPLHFAQYPLYLLRSAYLPLTAEQAAAADMAAVAADLPLDLRLTESERIAGQQRLAAALASSPMPARARIGLFAHATGQKCYPIAWWHELIRTIRTHAPGAQLLEFVPQDGRPRLADQVPVLYTPDLRLLGATLAATSVVVVADGGVMHLADAAGARVLGLFKTTEAYHYGPRSRSDGLQVHNASAQAVAARIQALL